MSTNVNGKPQEQTITAEQFNASKQATVEAQVAQLKAIGLPDDALKAAIKGLYKNAGLTMPAETFERYNFTVNKVGDKNHGKVIPLININSGKQSKSITLWQAEAIIANADEFILFVEQLRDELKAEGRLDADGKVVAK